MKVKEKLNKLFKSRFGRNIMMITGSSAVAQVIKIVASPIITRIYSPDEYGILSIYTAVIGGLSFFGSLNYELGIPISDEDEDAINIFGLSTIILAINTIILTIILIFWGHDILRLLRASQLHEYYIFIPIGLFMIGFYNINIQWAYRAKIYRSIAKTRLSQAVLNNVISILMGLVGFRSVGLIIGKILGQSGGIGTLFYPLLKYKRSLLKKISKKKMLLYAKRYRDFPIFSTPRRYLGDITVSLPILFITFLYGSEVVGFFGLANAVIQLPMNLIGTSVSNVYYAECASMKNTNPLGILRLSNKLLFILIAIGMLPLIVLLGFGPHLFKLVYGSNWIEAGVYGRLLSISIFFRFVFKPISNIFDIFEKQKIAFLLNLFRVMLVLLAFGVSYYLKLNSYYAIGLYSISMAIIYYIQFVIAQRIIKSCI